MGEDAASLDVHESVVFQTHLSPLNPSLGSDHCLLSLRLSKTVLVVLHLLPTSLPALQHQKNEQLLPLCSCFSSVILSPPAFGMSSSIPKLQGSGSQLTQDLQCQHNPLDLAHSLYRWMKLKIVHGQRQSPPLFLPGKSQEQRILEGYSPWNHKRVRNDIATETQQPILQGPPPHFLLPLGQFLSERWAPNSWLCFNQHLLNTYYGIWCWE